jgi:DNA polymerase I
MSSGKKRATWVVDAESTHHPSGLPDVVCLCAREVHTGRTISLWRDQLGLLPPFDIGEDAIVVFYSGMEAELAVLLALGHPLPTNPVDLIVEYRMAINGKGGSQGLGMLEACARLGVVPKGNPQEKKRMRDRVIAGWPFSDAERAEILAYCMGDVEDECAILHALQELGQDPLSAHAIWRGRFINSVARMWFRGVPIDPQYVSLATDHMARFRLKERMIGDIRIDYPIYDDNLVLKDALLDQWMGQQGIPVPRTPTGKPGKSTEELSFLARDYPVLDPLVESLKTQRQLKDFSLPIGSDCRLRAWFAPFWTITGRNAPPTNGYIYNLPAWMRSTMKPTPGYALAYLDYSAMEFGLAAACSGDKNMTDFYNSGDPYIATAVASGSLPAGATKRSHKDERDLYKTGSLSCLYGIAATSLGLRLKRSTVFAEGFLRMHRSLFHRYWEWSDAVVTDAIQLGKYVSRHGWTYAVHPPFNTRSLRNWPIQAAGSDILHCACILADQLEVEMLATAHDAVLIQAPEDRIDQAATDMSDCMRQAARILTGGFELRVDAEIKRAGERFIEERGKRTLAVVDRFLQEEMRA